MWSCLCEAQCWECWAVSRTFRYPSQCHPVVPTSTCRAFQAGTHPRPLSFFRLFYPDLLTLQMFFHSTLIPGFEALSSLTLAPSSSHEQYEQFNWVLTLIIRHKVLATAFHAEGTPTEQLGLPLNRNIELMVLMNMQDCIIKIVFEMHSDSGIQGIDSIYCQ